MHEESKGPSKQPDLLNQETPQGLTGGGGSNVVLDWDDLPQFNPMQAAGNTDQIDQEYQPMVAMQIAELSMLMMDESVADGIVVGHQVADGDQIVDGIEEELYNP